MKNLFFFILLFMSCDLLAQDPELSETSGKFQIGFSFSPNYSFRTIKSETDSEQNNFIVKSRNEIEIGKLSFSGGLNFLFPLNKILSLETGLFYSGNGYQTKESEVFIMVYSPDIPDKTRFVYHYHYVDVPFNASVTLGQKRVRFVGGLGVSANVFVAQTTVSYSIFPDHTEKNRSTSFSGMQRFNLSSLAFAGLCMQLNERSLLRLEPTFRYNIFKLVDAPIAERLWTTGLHARFLYTFK